MSETQVRAEFFKHAVLLGARSQAEGRPVYEDQDFVRISVIGSKDVFEAPAGESHRARFPLEWEAYQRQQTRPAEGTPVTEWPALTPAQVRNLQSFNVMTVEDMANASDLALQKIGMGSRELQEKARLFIAGSGRANELQAKVAEQETTIAQQNDLIAKQGALLSQLEQRIGELEARQPAAGKRAARETSEA